jgi:hypothetical protein
MLEVKAFLIEKIFVNKGVAIPKKIEASQAIADIANWTLSLISM